jgi:hypothetical protein
MAWNRRIGCLENKIQEQADITPHRPISLTQHFRLS